jgi:hypothetical protein
LERHHLGRDEPTHGDQGYGESGTQSKHHHLLGRPDNDPNYNEAGYGGGAASSQRQGQNFGAQDSPSLAAPYGGAAAGTQSKHHHHRDQENASPARNMADIAAAKIAGIEPTEQYSATQGSTAPSSSKYQQEHPVGAHDTRTAP